MTDRPSAERIAEIRDDNGTRGPEGVAIEELLAEIDALKAEDETTRAALKTFGAFEECDPELDRDADECDDYRRSTAGMARMVGERMNGRIDALKAELAEYHRRDAEDAEAMAAFDRAEAEADRLEKDRRERMDREYGEELYRASLRPDE